MAQVNENATVNTAAEETQATETKTEQQNAAPAPADQPGAPAQPEKEKKEHPVWDKVKTGAKKVGNFVKRTAPIVAAVGGGILLGKAIGKAEGYENALGKMNPSPNPTPELPGPTEDCGVDEIVDVDFGDVTVTDPVPVDTPAE